MRRPVLPLLCLAVALSACADGSAIDVTAPTTLPATTTIGPTPSGEVVVLSPSAGVERAGSADDAPVSTLAAGFNDAGFTLWRSWDVADNLVFSPSSIGHALLMARAAADTTTGAAIDEALALPDGMSAHEAWNAVDLAIAADADREDEITISIADRIWPRLGLHPDQGWIDLLERDHGVTAEALDFAGDPSGSREVINTWVSDRTEGLIPELLPEGFVDPATALVLTDAIYFKARWQLVFGKYQSVTDTFTRLDGTGVEVEYMRELELGDKRGAGDGFVGAELPYVGGDFSMLIIVPDEGRFAEIRDGLDQDFLHEVDSAFTTGPYELLLPGWNTTTALDLMPWLQDIGAAPGSYPAISPDSFLDGAVHGADITVDEWGTVAAAATALAFAESGPPEPEITIAADRPFLYLIRHRPSGLVLFAGQVTDPTA